MSVSLESSSKSLCPNGSVAFSRAGNTSQLRACRGSFHSSLITDVCVHVTANRHLSLIGIYGCVWPPVEIRRVTAVWLFWSWRARPKIISSCPPPI